MVNLNMEQQKALSIVARVAEQRHELKKVEQERLRQARAQIKAEVYAEFDQEMTQAVTQAKDLGVPNRRLGLAWGSSAPNQGSELAKKYWKSDRV